MLTKEDLLKIKLPLSQEDYNFLEQHEREFYRLTRDNELRDLEKNYNEMGIEMWEAKYPYVGYGDI